MITGHQIREARRLLGMTTTRLAAKSNLRLPVIQRAEAYDGMAPIGAAGCAAIKGVLETAGAIFHADNSVGLQPKSGTSAMAAKTAKAAKALKARTTDAAS